ncbi:MAG: hypothetical protein IOD12_09950 [Silvanigrellales bacterium]|nr:hypothetical protein [Silvanigrellales bacterium]
MIFRPPFAAGMSLLLSFLVFSVFGKVSTWPLFATEALAHEKGFPARQLAALTPTDARVTFKEVNVPQNAVRLKEFETKHTLKFGRGDLLGNLFLGAGTDGKTKVVGVFLDGKSSRGDTEFGATVTPQGRIAVLKVFSTPESADATSDAFLSTLVGKSADELSALRKDSQGNEGKVYIIELAMKAIGRVETSFSRK